MKASIKKAYDKAIFILNNGFEYEFYTRFDRRPSKFMIAIDENSLDFAISEKRKHMDIKDFEELQELIKKDKKPFQMASLPSKHEQLVITMESKKNKDI